MCVCAGPAGPSTATAGPGESILAGPYRNLSGERQVRREGEGHGKFPRWRDVSVGMRLR